MGAVQDGNKQVIERLVEAFNERERDAFDACYGDPILVHASTGEQRTMAHDEHWDEVLSMFSVFSDLTAQIDRMAAEGDHVFLRGRYTGTHDGDGGRWAPTGVETTWAWWCDYRLEDGRIVEAWNCYDDLSRLLELGLVELGDPVD